MQLATTLPGLESENTFKSINNYLIYNKIRLYFGISI